MCGIVGYFNSSNSHNQQNLDTIVTRMAAGLTHRGPDDVGFWVDEKSGVALGHRRLAIIDLSAKGHQPMSNEDKTVWVIFNGEIYNFKELSEDLKNKGHKFESFSDTETIIHAYEEYGEDCVRYLRGMFAFAIWDHRDKTFMLARDRVGKKPLLYYFDHNVFCFSSEFASLLESGIIESSINYEALHYYLTFGYIPAPFSIYNNVYKLLPAHTLVLKNKTLTLKQYWQLDYSGKIRISEREAADEVLRLLKEAVKVRLYSDVPLGAFLSGGIDSSVVVGLMSQLLGNKVKTFSVGFEEEEFSELDYARNIATRFNTDHNEFIVKPNALEVLPVLVERYGEPFADSSCIPTYYVSHQTRKYVTVALNGDGGDELFAGYERYQGMLLAEIYNKMPALTKRLANYINKLLPNSINPKKRLQKIKRFFEGVGLPKEQCYLRWICIFDDYLKNNLYSEDFKNRVLGKKEISWISPYFNSRNGLGLLDTVLLVDNKTYLPNDLLVKLDIASMANSLEVRSPFLDQKLMEFVATLPPEYKMKNLVKKYILKKAIRGIIPEENIHRRKMGFGVPVGAWFRNELKEFLSEILLSREALRRGYFQSEFIKSMIKQHINGSADYALQLWALLTLELWHRRFID